VKITQEALELMNTEAHTNGV